MTHFKSKILSQVNISGEYLDGIYQFPFLNNAVNVSYQVLFEDQPIPPNFEKLESVFEKFTEYLSEQKLLEYHTFMAIDIPERYFPKETFSDRERAEESERLKTALRLSWVVLNIDYAFDSEGTITTDSAFEMTLQFHDRDKHETQEIYAELDPVTFQITHVGVEAI